MYFSDDGKFSSEIVYTANSEEAARLRNVLKENGLYDMLISPWIEPQSTDAS